MICHDTSRWFRLHLKVLSLSFPGISSHWYNVISFGVSENDSLRRPLRMHVWSEEWEKCIDFSDLRGIDTHAHSHTLSHTHIYKYPHVHMLPWLWIWIRMPNVNECGKALTSTNWVRDWQTNWLIAMILALSSFSSQISFSLPLFLFLSLSSSLSSSLSLSLSLTLSRSLVWQAIDQQSSHIYCRPPLSLLSTPLHHELALASRVWPIRRSSAFATQNNCKKRIYKRKRKQNSDKV